MPTLTAMPMALPQGSEQEANQEFELDIRVTTPNVASPQLHNTSYNGSCEGSCNSCTQCTCQASCGGTCNISCHGTCFSCNYGC